MRKLNKRTNFLENTIEAYTLYACSCGCSCECGCNCSKSNPTSSVRRNASNSARITGASSAHRTVN